MWKIWRIAFVMELKNDPPDPLTHINVGVYECFFKNERKGIYKYYFLNS